MWISALSRNSTSTGLPARKMHGIGQVNAHDQRTFHHARGKRTSKIEPGCCEPLDHAGLQLQMRVVELLPQRRFPLGREDDIFVGSLISVAGAVLLLPCVLMTTFRSCSTISLCSLLSRERTASERQPGGMGPWNGKFSADGGLCAASGFPSSCPALAKAPWSRGL